VNIEPAVLFGAISATVSALVGAIVALFKIINNYSEDLKSQRDKALKLAEDQSAQISELISHQDRLARALETLTYGLERWGVPPNALKPGAGRTTPPRSERPER